MTPEEFRVVEALVTEKSREIARTEISRALRGIADDLNRAFMSGRFDEHSEADIVVSYLDDTIRAAANRAANDGPWSR
jgi:hypothetical protein